MRKLLLGLCAFFLYGAETVLAHGGVHPLPAPPPPAPTPVPLPQPTPPTPATPAPTPTAPPGTPQPTPATPTPQPPQPTPNPNPGGPTPIPGQTPVPVPTNPQPTGPQPPSPVPTRPGTPQPATPTPQPGTPSPQPGSPAPQPPGTPSGPAAPTPVTPRPNGGQGGMTPPAPLSPDQAARLTWMEWWKRHGDLYTFVPKARQTVTGTEGGSAPSAKLEVLVDKLVANLDDRYFDVRAASCLALGKVGANTEEVRRGLLKAMKDKNSDVQESAVLALGMIHAVECSDAVVAILRHKQNDEGMRCFAAVSLGLMGSPANLGALQGVYGAPDTKEEVRAGCILGLGLLGDERAVYALYPAAMGAAKEEIQAFAVTALANIGKVRFEMRTGRRTAEVDLLEVFGRKLVTKETPTEVRRALALALGEIGDDEGSLRALQQAYRADRDKGVRGFALLSMALLKKGEGARQMVLDTLVRAMKTESDAMLRGFATLAVGLTRDPAAGPDLLALFTGKAEAEVRAAAAIGLGLLKYTPAMPDLGREVENPKDGGEARGYAAVALGMIGDRGATDCLKTVLETVRDPYLQWASATGLALLKDTSAIPMVLAKLDDKNRITRESAIRSIAFFREDATLEPILEQFGKEDSNEIRALMVVTLGNIAEASEDMPVLRKVGRNVNWVAAQRLKAVDLLTRLF